jgi:hypothetical protein
MFSNTQRSSPALTPSPLGSKAQKTIIETKYIPRPAGCTISSVQSLADFVKQQNIEWLQTKPQQNLFLQHARNAVNRVLERNADEHYITTWAKTPTQQKMSMVRQFTNLEPCLNLFENDWVAELFLSKCIKTKNVNRRGQEHSEPLEGGTLILLIILLIGANLKI